MESTRATPEDMQAVKPALSQDSAKSIEGEAKELCKSGLEDNDVFERLESIFEQVKDTGNWKAGAVHITPVKNEAVDILASFLWYHSDGKVVALDNDKFMVFSSGYAA